MIKKTNNWTSYLLVIVTIIILFNQYQIYGISKSMGGSTGMSGGDMSSVIPKGIPIVYGAELGISYDDINAKTPNKADATIAKLGSYDTSTNGPPSQLNEDLMKRYLSITTEISCEYCCGAQAITSNNGRAACGCAHSYAMRGLAQYLLINHAKEFTDDQILEELGKWKTLFFPTVMMQKASVLQSKGIELNYINLASNKYRGIEKGATSGGSMVGGC